MNKQNFNISTLNLAIFCQNFPSAEAFLHFGGTGEKRKPARSLVTCAPDFFVWGIAY